MDEPRTLKDLIGLHVLSGAEFSESLEDANRFSFILDGVVYSAVEDPEDGWRSSMKELQVNQVVVNNVFAGQQVFCTLRQEDTNILDCYDIQTTLLVLSVGTDYSDSWYPSFIAEFTPENMACNTSKDA